ncbi:hypothetical protein RRG08_022288 [Elysia crispata]|uniref:Uncharacterized protein n=1 Tax=Elysia crispata TaxID=231223 RepID=A0AAE1DK13_9GAST|nr:hypothetical protein RRG08_022288 [Elysia crispata]
MPSSATNRRPKMSCGDAMHEKDERAPSLVPLAVPGLVPASDDLVMVSGCLLIDCQVKHRCFTACHLISWLLKPMIVLVTLVKGFYFVKCCRFTAALTIRAYSRYGRIIVAKLVCLNFCSKIPAGSVLFSWGFLETSPHLTVKPSFLPVFNDAHQLSCTKADLALPLLGVPRPVSLNLTTLEGKPPHWSSGATRGEIDGVDFASLRRVEATIRLVWNALKWTIVLSLWQRRVLLGTLPLFWSGGELFVDIDFMASSAHSFCTV